MPTIKMTGGRIVYDRGLCGIYVSDDGGTQYPVEPYAVEAIEKQRVEIERLRNMLIDNFSWCPDCSNDIGDIGCATCRELADCDIE